MVRCGVVISSNFTLRGRRNTAARGAGSLCLPRASWDTPAYPFAPTLTSTPPPAGAQVRERYESRRPQYAADDDDEEDGLQRALPDAQKDPKLFLMRRVIT